jgi:membrane protein
MSSIREMLGDTGAKAVEAMLAGASRPAAGVLATILGIGALLFAAIGVVVQLKDALNVVWDVEEFEESGLWHFAAITCCRSPRCWRSAFFCWSRY